MSNKEIERLNIAMKQTSDKRLYERFLAVRLRLEATYTLANANEEVQTFFKKHTFAQLKKQVEAEPINHLLFEDESMIRSYQALQYNGFPRSKQRKVPTYGKHEGAKLFGAINYETGQVHHREEEKADTAAFIRFLQDILSAYPNGKMTLILDNSRIHHATELQLVFLPPYSPNLNPVEGLWLWLKADVVNNIFFEKFYKIRLHVSQFMKQINNQPMETIDRLLVRL